MPACWLARLPFDPPASPACQLPSCIRACVRVDVEADRRNQADPNRMLITCPSTSICVRVSTCLCGCLLSPIPMPHPLPFTCHDLPACLPVKPPACPIACLACLPARPPSYSPAVAWACVLVRRSRSEKNAFRTTHASTSVCKYVCVYVRARMRVFGVAVAFLHPLSCYPVTPLIAHHALPACLAVTCLPARLTTSLPVIMCACVRVRACVRKSRSPGTGGRESIHVCMHIA